MSDYESIKIQQGRQNFEMSPHITPEQTVASLGEITTFGHPLDDRVVVNGEPCRIVPEQRIAELEAQVARLQEAFFGLAEEGDAKALGETLGLRPGDLDPMKGEGE